MPTVPRYNATITQNVSQTQQRLSASPDAFGASAAQALGNVGQGLDMIAQRREEMRLEEANTNARARANDITRQANELQIQWLETRGINASQEAYEDYERRVQDLFEQGSEGLNDPDARRMYNDFAVRQSNNFIMQGARHRASQRRERDIAVASEAIENYNAQALSARGTPEFYETLSMMEEEVTRLGQLAGRDGDQIASDVRNVRAGTITAAIAASIDSGDVRGAEAMYNEAVEAGEFEETTSAAQAEALVNAAMTDIRIQENRDEIIARFRGNPDAAIRHVMENFEGAEETSLLRSVRQGFRDLSVAQGDASATALMQAEEMFRNGDVTDISQLPILLRHQLGARGEAILESAFVENRNGLFAPVEDTIQIEQIMWEAQNDPDALVDRDPTDFAQYVTNREQYDMLVGIYRSISDITQREASFDAARELLSDRQALDAYMEVAGVELESEEGLEWAQRAQQRLQDAGDITAEERNAILADLANETVRMRGSGMFGFGTSETEVSTGSATLGEPFEDVGSGLQDVMIQFYADEYGGSVPRPEQLRPTYDRYAAFFAEVNDGMAPVDDREGRAGFRTWLQMDRQASIVMARMAREQAARLSREQRVEPPLGEEALDAETTEDAGPSLGERWDSNFEGAREGLQPVIDAITPDMTPGQVRAELLTLGYSREAAERYTSGANIVRGRAIVRQGQRATGDDRG